MNFTFRQIATVKSTRSEAYDDNWLAETSEIILDDEMPSETLAGIGAFSHLESIYAFHKLDGAEPILAAHPRGNTAYPFTGIFAQRKRDRPNFIGLCTVELISVDDRKLTVKYLDAIDGTPVLDIKPVMKEFEPQSDIRQPEWSTDLMKQYW